ncbi:MAG: putative S-layer protein [Candidatus Peregrinibacteria bacterium Gr01-1014_25]|nr:MAG: putative S-layer protein [Candidatus Peregrinibacteria bacterium Gr01-1014_25]
MRALLTLIAALLVTTAHAAAPTPLAPDPFTDVPSKHPNGTAIEYLRVNNVVRGYGDGTFKPEARINRAEFLQIITNPFLLSDVRTQECVRENIVNQSKETVFYSDVAKDAWFASPVCIATVQKIVNGYPDGTFRPGNYVTFVEAAKIVAGISGFLTTPSQDEPWYAPYIRKLSDGHAIPTTISTLDEVITRGEMAEMLWRMKEGITTKQSRTAEALMR